ncbi:MAG: hypothetical protein ACRDRG_20895 [Pseudonocardiaceae bacterium]
MAGERRALPIEGRLASFAGATRWRAFSNRFWPALYIADAEGRLRYHHFGEGEYAMAEMVIHQLLLETGAQGIDQDLVVVQPRGLEVAADWPTLQSPETYLGYAQSTGFASQTRARFDLAHHYAATPQLPLNYWDLSGTWTVAQLRAPPPGRRATYPAQRPIKAGGHAFSTAGNAAVSPRSTST